MDGGDKSEFDGLAGRIARLRIRCVVGYAFQVRVRIRLEPRHISCRCSVWHFRSGRSVLVRQQALMLAAGKGIETDVGCDLIQPGAKRPSFEGLEAAPGAQIGFLHRVLGFVHGAKHAVTMHFYFSAEWFGQSFKCPCRPLRRLIVT